jgi:hypothetical protein
MVGIPCGRNKMSADALAAFVSMYFTIGFFAGLFTGINRESVVDGFAMGIFWPLFVVKRAVKLLME